MDKKIVLDTRWIRGKKIDGIGRVCLSYVKELVKSNYDFVLLYHNEDTKSILSFEVGKLKNIEFKYVPFDILSIRDFVLLPSFLRKNHTNFYLSFNYLTSPFHKGYHGAVYIHDFIPYIFKEEFKKASLKWRLFFHQKWLIKRMMNSQDIVFSDSQSTKDDAIRIFNLDGEKIFVSYNSSTLNENIKEKSPFDTDNIGSYFLYVGRKDEYKNVSRLIDCFTSIKNETKLVIAGPSDKEFYQSAKEKYKDRQFWNNVIFLDNLKESELLYLYKHAIALVHLSLYEGFGLTVLEAMKLGTPVICSNNSSISEIAGDVALFVDPKDNSAIKDALHSIINDADLRKKLSDKGKKRAGDFEWSKLAGKVIEKIKETI